MRNPYAVIRAIDLTWGVVESVHRTADNANLARNALNAASTGRPYTVRKLAVAARPNETIAWSHLPLPWGDE